MLTYYEILGCEEDASYEELKKSYHEQVKKCHPDKSDDESRQKFLLLDKAWKTLRCEDTRREYDLALAKNKLDETPLYCVVSLSEMTFESETRTYSYPCRCGGVYVVEQNCVNNCDTLKMPCDECTFHIVINVDR